MSKINNLYNHGDIKYYRYIHKQKMQELGLEPVKYHSFHKRLTDGTSLKDAIYTPRWTNMVRYNTKPKKKPSLRIRFISLFKGLF